MMRAPCLNVSHSSIIVKVPKQNQLGPNLDLTASNRETRLKSINLILFVLIVCLILLNYNTLVVEMGRGTEDTYNITLIKEL